MQTTPEIPDPPALDAPVLTPEQVRENDTARLAEGMGWKLEEAERYVAAAEEGSKLEQALHANASNHGGVWLEMGPDMRPRFVVQYAVDERSAQQIVGQHIGDAGTTVDYVRVENSLEVELRRAEQASRALSSDLEGASMLFDIRTREIVVRSAEPDAAEKLAVAQLRNPELGRIRIDPLAATTTSIAAGGLRSGVCTSGFTAVRGLEYGMLAAEHCGLQALDNINGTTHDPVSRTSNWPRDLRFLSSQGMLPTTNNMWDGSAWRPITSTTGILSQTVGFPACSYGQTTANAGGGCGTIAQKWLQGAQGRAFSYVELDGGGSPAFLAWTGDSGGPVFWGNSAYGINHAASTVAACQNSNGSLISWPPSNPGCTSSDLVYSPINYVADLNGSTQVLTAGAQPIQMLSNTKFTGANPVHSWVRRNGTYYWAVYGGGYAGQNFLEFNCVGAAPGCSVSSDVTQWSNAGTKHQPAVWLRCNAATTCPVTVAVWGLWNGAEVGFQQYNLSPGVWVNSTFVTAGLSAQRSQIRFEIYNNHGSNNVDIAAPRLFVVP